jgi:DNA-binding response OmpR family regulator
MILVVDHDPEVLEQAQKILNREHQVLLASTAAQALDMMQRLGFSVVLVDLELPGGYALIQLLHDKNPSLLIIGVRGAVKASVQQGTETGAIVEYLQKPITPEWKPVVERVRAKRAGAA